VIPMGESSKQLGVKWLSLVNRTQLAARLVSLLPKTGAGTVAVAEGLAGDGRFQVLCLGRFG
jgi:hypothetical protein